jgi:uracil-DNA glycosylase
MSKFLVKISIHPSWNKFFAEPQVIKELKKIDIALIGVSFTPGTNVALRFAELDLKKIKVSIWGKDPYPQYGVATGRSFEVAGVTSWFDTDVNSSLKNIIKLIHKGYTESNQGASIEVVRNDIHSREFPILPPNKAFSDWESQGVLFLNTAFTCEVDKIGSHLSLWKPFFQLLMEYITTENPNISYFLWGHAKKYEKPLKKLGVNEKQLYLSNHPCTNGDAGGYQNGTKFLNCPCFKETFRTVFWIKE